MEKGYHNGLEWAGKSSFERVALWVRSGQRRQRIIPLDIDRMRNTCAFSRRTSACSTGAMSRYKEHFNNPYQYYWLFQR